MFDWLNDEVIVTYLGGDYTGESCPNCDRVRVMLCQDGKRYCEKCWWCIEDNNYGSTEGKQTFYKTKEE